MRGFTTKQLAHELCISAKTVETHRTHINEKLAAHCSADLVRYAFRNSVPLSSAASSASVRSGQTGGSGPGKRAGRAQPPHVR